MIIRLWVACLAMLVAAVTIEAVQEPTTFLVLGQDQYVVPVHTSAKRLADFVFHTGERVTFQVRLSNVSGTEARLRTSAVRPGEIITAKLIRVAPPPLQEVPVRLDPVGPVKVGNERKFPVQWGDEIAIPQFASLVVPVAVMAPPELLTPGAYEVRVASINVDCEPACRLRDYSGLFSFEIRNGDGIPEQLDVLFRRAYRDIHDAESAAAAAPELIREMLRLYPTSTAAHELRAKYAERFGRWSEAASAYEVAAKLSESRQDRLRQSDSSDLAASLRERAAEARLRVGR